MNASSGGEENVRWSKRLSTITADVFTSARGDEVDLIARVWLLWICSARRIDLDQQTSVLEHSGEALTLWTG